MQTLFGVMTYLDIRSWIIQVFIVVFITLLINFIQSRLLVKIRAQVEKTKSYWDDALIDAVPRPLTLLIWLIGLTLAAEIVKEETHSAIFSAVEPIRDIGVVFAFTWFLVNFIRQAEKHIISNRQQQEIKFDRTTIDAIARLLRISVIITAFLVILQTLGYSISGVLAFGGIGGIIVGFAAKDMLANFFGGLMIYLDRPFSVGDWIRSPDQEIEGTVEHIGWRLTHIRTPDKRPLYVPNSVFNTISVENPSRMTHRCIHETIGIRYEDAGKMADIVAAVKKMLKEHDGIDSRQTVVVNFSKFASLSLDFFIYAFTSTTDGIRYHEIKQDVLLKIINIIEKHGAKCVFPTSTLQNPRGVTGIQK
ncbi:MAG: mechanosensitive ion channel family protein [Gammaproteobacteria bacterium]|nr:mechanosensitive ion channel family protein [Gammaproteobacteria bacterium]